MNGDHPCRIGPKSSITGAYFDIQFEEAKFNNSVYPVVVIYLHCVLASSKTVSKKIASILATPVYIDFDEHFATTNANIIRDHINEAFKDIFVSIDEVDGMKYFVVYLDGYYTMTEARALYFRDHGIPRVIDAMVGEIQERELTLIDQF